MWRRAGYLSLIITTLLIQAACLRLQDDQAFSAWDYADLRQLDEVDARSPSHDLIALYTRSNGSDMQIRLDFLDHPQLPDYDLYILLDHAPGGSQQLPLDLVSELHWDSLLVIPATGGMLALDPSYQAIDGAGLHVLRDSIMDTVVISLRQTSLGFGSPFAGRLPALRVQAVLTPAGSPTPADMIGPISTHDSPPKPLETLFVFWNSLPAYSPAIALRRWDGAHTGPYGGRHGLYNLLRTANSAGIPLALLDLKAPASLAALDYLGGLEMVSQMEASGLLMLPEYLPDISTSDSLRASQLAEQLLKHNQQTSSDFELPISPFLSSHAGLIPARMEQRLIFQRQAEPAEAESAAIASIARRGAQLIIPIQAGGMLANPEQASLDGPTLELRRALVDAAVAPASSSSLLLLGGDLPTSTWGSPQAARATFNYIRAHPWIRPLDAHALLSSQPTDGQTAAAPSAAVDWTAQLPDDLLTELITLPENQISRLAWDAVQSLYSPVFPQPAELPALRSHYLANVWSLIVASQWAHDPTSWHSCDFDPDHDGQPECLLASERFYTQIEIDSAGLSFAFARLEDDPAVLTQWVAPSSQFAVGLSDPGSWDLNRGALADPTVLPGAFYEDGFGYQVAGLNQPYELIFTSADSRSVKTYTLTPTGLTVAYRSDGSALSSNPRLPIALAPWGRFTRDWSANYNSSKNPGTWTWSYQDQPYLESHTQTGYNFYSFQDSQQLLGRPEDPNQEYPKGHFLPFPFAMIELTSSANFTVEIDIRSSNR